MKGNDPKARYRDLRPQAAVMAFLRDRAAEAETNQVRVTRDDLSTTTGTSKRTVGRVLATLRSEGVITTEPTTVDGRFAGLKITIRNGETE